MFHRLNHNPLLRPQGSSASAESMPIDALRERVWQPIEPDHPQPLASPAIDDLVIKRSGKIVVVVPVERMPTDTGAAAIHRY